MGGWGPAYQHRYGQSRSSQALPLGGKGRLEQHPRHSSSQDSRLDEYRHHPLLCFSKSLASESFYGQIAIYTWPVLVQINTEVCELQDGQAQTQYSQQPLSSRPLLLVRTRKFPQCCTAPGQWLQGWALGLEAAQDSSSSTGFAPCCWHWPRFCRLAEECPNARRDLTPSTAGQAWRNRGRNKAIVTFVKGWNNWHHIALI